MHTKFAFGMTAKTLQLFVLHLLAFSVIFVFLIIPLVLNIKVKCA